MNKRKYIFILLFFLFLVVGCTQSEGLPNHDNNTDYTILKDEHINFTYIVPNGYSIIENKNKWYYNGDVYFFFYDKDAAYAFKNEYKLEDDIAFCESNDEEELYYLTKDMRLKLSDSIEINDSFYSLYNEKTKEYYQATTLKEFERACDELNDYSYNDIEFNENNEITKISKANVSLY